MRAVFHTWGVAAQERRRDSLRQRELHEFARARKGAADQLRNLGIFRIARVRLQVVLGVVGGIAGAAFDEAQLAAHSREACDLGRREQVADLEQHEGLPPESNAGRRLGAAEGVARLNDCADRRALLLRQPRTPDVADENDARLIAVVPRLVLDRVVEYPGFADSPLARLA